MLKSSSERKCLLTNFQILAVGRDRLAVNLNRTMPLIVDILVLPRPKDADPWELQTSMVKVLLF